MDISKLLPYGCLSLTFLFAVVNQWLDRNWLFIAEVFPCSIMILCSFWEQRDILWIFAGSMELMALWMSVAYVCKRKKALFLLQEICCFSAYTLLLWSGYCNGSYATSVIHFATLSVVLSGVKWMYSSLTLATIYALCSFATTAAFLFLDEPIFVVVTFFLLVFSMEFFKTESNTVGDKKEQI